MNEQRAAARFLFALLLLTTTFRVVALWRAGIPHFTVDDTPGPWMYGTAVILSVVHDATLLACIVGLVLVAGRLSGERLAILASMALMWAALSYYWLDLVYFTGTRLRLHGGLIAALTSPILLWESAPVGIGLVAGGSVVFAVVALVYRYMPGIYGDNIVWNHVFAAIGLGVMTVAGAVFLPRTLHYAASNVVIHQVVDIVTTARLGRDALPSVPPSLQPRGERYERIDPEYPLLKHTDGFEGPTQFDILVRPGERPHVVFILLSAFRAAEVGALGAPHQPSATPRFDRLARSGVLFTRFYANGVQPIGAGLATLFGIPPRFTRRSVMSGQPDLPLIGLPDLLATRDYRAAHFYNGPPAGQPTTDFLVANGFDELHGPQDIASRQPDADAAPWGVHDEYMMRDLVEWMATRDAAGEPAFVTAFTASNRSPWNIPVGHDPPDFGAPSTGQHADYLQTLHYADHSLGHFVDLLRARGLARRTIVFVLSDTAQPMGEHDENYSVRRHLYEENVRIPLLILADGRVAGPVRVDAPASQIDLLPTVMDVLGLTGPNHAVGSSLRRAVTNRLVPFGNPFHLRSRGGVAAGYKYVWSPALDREALYRLDDDPTEIDPLRGFPPEANALRSALRQSAQFIDRLYRLRAFRPVQLPAQGLP